MMLLPLQCRTETNWLRTEQSKHYATGLYTYIMPTVKHKWWNHRNVNWSQGKAKVGDGEEVGRSTDSGRAGIVGVISTLEHTRGLVAGRSCSLVPDTGMVTYERFWILRSTIFIQVLYTIPTARQTCRYSQIGTGVLFICHMSHHDCYGQPHMVDTVNGVMLNPWRVWTPCKSRILHIKTSLFHPVVIIIGHDECWMLQEWVHEGERCTTFNWLVNFYLPTQSLLHTARHMHYSWANVWLKNHGTDW